MIIRGHLLKKTVINSKILHLRILKHAKSLAQIQHLRLLGTSISEGALRCCKLSKARTSSYLEIAIKVHLLQNLLPLQHVKFMAQIQHLCLTSLLVGQDASSMKVWCRLELRSRTNKRYCEKAHKY